MTQAPRPVRTQPLQDRIALEEYLLKKQWAPSEAVRAREAQDNALDDDALLREALRRIQNATHNWDGERCGQAVPVFGANLKGTLPPLFWCFNAKAEPMQMAKFIGAEQPIYALRSLNQLFGTGGIKRRIAPLLGKVYAAEIERIYPSGPYLLGGNCQAASIVETACRELIARGRQVAQLTFLDAHPCATRLPARLCLLYGKSSDQNPFRAGEAPETGWDDGQGTVVWDQIDGEHGTYFTDQNMPDFMAHLNARMREALAAC